MAHVIREYGCGGLLHRQERRGCTDAHKLLIYMAFPFAPNHPVIARVEQIRSSNLLLQPRRDQVFSWIRAHPRCRRAYVNRQTLNAFRSGT